MSENVIVTPPANHVTVQPEQPSVRIGAQAAAFVVEPYVIAEETEDGVRITCTARGETTSGTVYNGSPGAPGVSPSVSVSDITGGHRITVTDAEGSHVFDVMDGQDGVSPTVSVSDITGGHRITVTDAEGSHVVDVMDGQDGVSPTVSVSDITDGHRITVTDAEGSHVVDVMDGQDGATFTPSVSEDGDLSWTNDGGLPNPSTVNIKGPPGSAGANDKVTQAYTDPANYTYWRGVIVGASSSSAETGSLASPTDIVRTFKTLMFQPSTGTLKTNTFKGNLEGDVTGDVTGTASGNYVKPADGIPSSDLEDSYAKGVTANGEAYRAVSIPYGEVDSTSTNTAYTVTVPGITELRDGVVCYIRNDVVTSTTNFTLNVNGLGAKPVYQNSADATRIASTFSAAVTWLFIYNEKRVTGGCWDAYYGYVNSNTIGYQVRTNSSTMALSDRCYRYRLLFTSADGTKFVPANTSTSTNATATRTTNTTPIDPFGTIYYYGSTTAKAAGDKVSATVIWQQYVITLGYSFNNTGAALTLTASLPVYITATPQADGSAVLDYFTQSLPTTNDGKIYIFLGTAIDATTVEIQINHPVYYHNGAGIRRWTGGA